jgi:hypothetical protein
MDTNIKGPAIDRTGKKLLIMPDGLIKLDGVIIFRAVEREGQVCLQFVDHDRLRVQCRGSRYIEIPLEVLIDKIQRKDSTDEQPAATPGTSEQQPGGPGGGT